MYSAIARQGYTHVIVLMIAECLSSANNLMRLAAEEHPELTVKVFDSKSASIGLGALAVQVARYAVRGVAFDPLCELTKRLIDDTVVYFSLDTLEYLQRVSLSAYTRMTEFVIRETPCSKELWMYSR